MTTMSEPANLPEMLSVECKSKWKCTPATWVVPRQQLWVLDPARTLFAALGVMCEGKIRGMSSALAPPPPLPHRQQTAAVTVQL